MTTGRLNNSADSPGLKSPSPHPEAILESHASDWAFRGEGGANLVLGYVGADPLLVSLSQPFLLYLVLRIHENRLLSEGPSQSKKHTICPPTIKMRAYKLCSGDRKSAEDPQACKAWCRGVWSIDQAHIFSRTKVAWAR